MIIIEEVLWMTQLPTIMSGIMSVDDSSRLKPFPAAKVTLHAAHQRAATSSDLRQETKHVPVLRLK